MAPPPWVLLPFININPSITDVLSSSLLNMTIGPDPLPSRTQSPIELLHSKLIFFPSYDMFS